MGISDYLYEKKSWHRIGVRIIGSWVAASSLLVLALAFSPNSQGKLKSNATIDSDSAKQRTAQLYDAVESGICRSFLSA
jgi:hypothetical protein